MSQTTRYPWTDDMREISGFGGTYEEACRRAVSAGLEWLDARPEVVEKLGLKQSSNVIGIIWTESPEGKAFLDALAHAADSKGGATGAMVQATANHTLYARRVGWSAYCAEMRQRKRDERKDVK